MSGRRRCGARSECDNMMDPTDYLCTRCHALVPESIHRVIEKRRAGGNVALHAAAIKKAHAFANEKLRDQRRASSAAVITDDPSEHPEAG